MSVLLRNTGVAFIVSENFGPPLGTEITDKTEVEEIENKRQQDLRLKEAIDPVIILNIDCCTYEHYLTFFFYLSF